MPNPNQTDLLDGMIARLEEANTRAYVQLAPADEGVSKSEQDAARHPTDQQDPSAAPKRQSSRARLLFLALIGLVLAASVCITAFAWEPSAYGDATKLIIARWANAWVLQTEPQAQTTPQDGASAAPLISPEIGQRLQTMADDLANVEQQIEQLKASQEQIVRRDAAVTEQLNAALAEMARHHASVTEQLKATQEQLAEVAASRPANSARKLLRRKPVSILPSLQKRAQAQSPVR
jgi:hypothetical protein